MKSGIIVILYAVIITLAAIHSTKAQEVTYCYGPNGEVIMVTDYTCPAGWTPEY